MVDRAGMQSSTHRDGGPAIVPDSHSLILSGRATGDEYRIDIAAPAGAMPAAGWPAIFLLDGSGCFGTCVEAMRRMSRRPDATAVVPMVVVAISSTAASYDVPRRQRDFTTAVAGQDGAVGGAGAFLDFLIDEVMPLVGSRFVLDPDRRTLFGHSLAGYFVLWTMLNRGDAFRNYAAISPSVWWDRQGLFDASDRVEALDRRLIVAMGEWEDALPPWQSVQPDSAEVAARRKARDMVGNARELCASLAARQPGASVEFMLLPQEDHASIVSTAMPRALRLASKD